ncbi:MAG TPA: FKBP-type peptidyl-prolyl cis-trans isomerase [Sporichthyaceae bacterium]|jgi:peptidylprolyl isomerase
MRRAAALLLSLGLVLSGCGGHAKPQATGVPQDLRNTDAPFAFPTVSSNDLGVDPTITASTSPPAETMLKVLHQGSGPALTAADIVVADLKGQVWENVGKGLQPFQDTFANGDLFVQPLNKVIPAWTAKLPGVQVGSRVLLIAASKDAFGLKPPAGTNILPNDTLMFVIDVLGAFPRDRGPVGAVQTVTKDASLPTVSGTTNPTVSVPKGKAPTSLVQQLLVAGKGPKVKDAQWLAVQYTGLIWGTGKPFDSTWTRPDGATPVAIRMAPPGTLNGTPVGGAVRGLIQALVGRAVGSRLLVVVPPALGYGAAGNTRAGITAKDTLVFVIDILGAYRTGVLAASAK